jgi:hypothetical protein
MELRRRNTIDDQPLEVYDSLIRQHIITSSVFIYELKASCLTRHWVGYKVKFQDRNEGGRRQKEQKEIKDRKKERLKLRIVKFLAFL